MLLTYRNRVYVRKIEITEMLLTYRNRVYVSIFIDMHKHKYTKIIWMKNYKFQSSQATQSFPLPASGFMKIKKLCTRKGCLFTILQLSQKSTQSCSRVQQSPSSLQPTSSMHCPPFPSFTKIHRQHPFLGLFLDKVILQLYMITWLSIN